MKKKLFAAILLSGMVVFSSTGCQGLDSLKKETEIQTEAVTEIVTETETETEIITETEIVSAQVCSLCEIEKECGIYEVDGEEYIVCDNCYNEFAYAFGLKDAPADAPLQTQTAETSVAITPAAVPAQVCSLCEVAKPCGTYEVNGQTYVVCDNCYDEFAVAFGLKEPSSPVCSLCEVAKPCGTYEVNGQTYVVCDNCYNEFATAFGLDS